MPILECLFSSDSNEVVQKVSERTAYYIGTTKAYRIDIFKTIKGSYDARSKFVDGQSVRTNYTKLSEQAMSKDNIVRKVLTKLIEQDDKIFLGKENELNKYLIELIFNQNVCKHIQVL
ncbi:hypothetical protein EZ449_12235 [Pedobacter frigidisoli]|uniref:Uncharacterized protein n=1 Tax=Pedobacter frigidisoli TaxID=2530455 RepID=A0A4R0P0A4_9SPHI|nr:hypothetical protein EZ449_12235 [Pedobacter frigidisoli]